jgi:hypothetical protein
MFQEIDGTKTRNKVCKRRVSSMNILDGDNLIKKNYASSKMKLKKI